MQGPGVPFSGDVPRSTQFESVWHQVESLRLRLTDLERRSGAASAAAAAVRILEIPPLLDEISDDAFAARLEAYRAAIVDGGSSGESLRESFFIAEDEERLRLLDALSSL